MIIIGYYSAVFPRFYSYRDDIDNDIMSVNGSSEDGNCNLTLSDRVRCREPTTSVLQDGNIPTLTGLDGDMWASQLLTINTANSSIDITFNFRNITPSYDGLEIVELVLFNCPEWGISVDNITLLVTTTASSIGRSLITISPTNTSCDSLVRVCISISVSTNDSISTLSFQLSPAFTWVHLAEVSFYEADPTCPPDSILNITPPPITSESVTSATTIMTSSIADLILIIIPVVIVISIICIIITIVIVLVSVRYSSPRYKNNTSADITLREGHTTSHGQVMIEETGQVYYSTVQSNVDDPSDQMYAQVDKKNKNATMEVETSRGNSFVLRDNEAYTTWK